MEMNGLGVSHVTSRILSKMPNSEGSDFANLTTEVWEEAGSWAPPADSDLARLQWGSGVCFAERLPDRGDLPRSQPH